MALILGSSHAMRLRRRLREDDSRGLAGVSAAGIPGGLLGSARHHKWFLQMAKAQRLRQVILLLGGNDLCRRDFDLPQLSDDIYTLGLGLLAVGVDRVWMMPILPRFHTRDGDVTPEQYEDRRRAANRILGTRFRRPPVTMLNVCFSSAHIGRDGVHLSRVGEDAVLDVIRCPRL